MISGLGDRLNDELVQRFSSVGTEPESSLDIRVVPSILCRFVNCSTNYF